MSDRATDADFVIGLLVSSGALISPTHTQHTCPECGHTFREPLQFSLGAYGQAYRLGYEQAQKDGENAA